ncbi:MAG: glycosyltransferase family 39 protein [Deltaproteobacteria bacterium]|nr:glycosyltransferase family 39 protein [Deltaproteobacteria bacterium]
MKFCLEDICRLGFALGLSSLIVFALGHAGLITPPFLLLPIFIPAAFLLFFAWRWKRTRLPQEWTLYEKFLAAAVVFSIIIAVPLALIPPVVRDELISHLAIPKLYLQKGAIHEIPFMNYSYLPQNIDLLYMVSLGLGSDVVPKLIHLGFAVATGLVIYFYLSRASGRATGLVGMLLYLATPLVANLSRTAYIDHGAAFYSTLAVVAALRWREDDGFRWLAVSAISTGLALSAKYNTILTFALITGFVFMVRVNKKQYARSLADTAVFIAVAVFVLSPWLARNYLWTGSPLYPIYESAASSVGKGEGVHVTTELAPIAKRIVLYDEGALDIVLIPIRIFIGGEDNSIQKFDGVLNPLFLVLMPLAFIKRRGGDIKYLALFAGLFITMAILSVDLVTRYLLPVIPLFAIFAALGLRNLYDTRLKWLAIALAVATVGFCLAYEKGLYDKYRPLSYLFGNDTREAYLERMLPDYKAVSYANSRIPEGSRVFLLFSGDRGYYWERDYFYGDRMGKLLKVMVLSSKNAEEFKARLRAIGITHLFFNDEIFERFLNDNFDGDGLKRVAEFFNVHAKRLFDANGYSIYEIK